MTCYGRGDDSISQILNVGHIKITIVNYTQKLKDVKKTYRIVLKSLEKFIIIIIITGIHMTILHIYFQ